MANITLQSSLRTVTLDEVVGYDVVKTTGVPFKKIPGRLEPLDIDIDGLNPAPREYVIKANVSRTTMDSLFDLEKDREWITFNNGTLTDHVFMVNMESRQRRGFEYPFSIVMTMLSSAN